MIVSLIRTAILYVAVIIGLRIMGKRQIGDMQPNELVITILISEIATVPIQDMNQPVIYGITAIALLVAMEVLLSVTALKSGAMRNLVNGRPVIVIRHGEIDQQAMKRLRMTMDDLMESLRQNQVFEVSEVDYAIVETNGNVSVMLTPGDRPLTAGQANVSVSDAGLSVPVICDGKKQPHFMQAMNIEESRVDGLLNERDLKADEVFLMTLDANGGCTVVKKEEAQ